MYSEGSTLKIWTGLEPSEAARSMVARPKECSVCSGLPAPLGLYKCKDLETWAAAEHERIGEPVVAIANDKRCPVCESQLHAVVGIPDPLLVGIAKNLSERQRRFLENRFVFPVCGRCCKTDRIESVRSIRNRYQRVVATNPTTPDADNLLEEVLG